MISRISLGIKKTEEGYNTIQIQTAGWIFLIGTPFLLLFLPDIIVPFWSLFILIFLILFNFDESLTLIKLISKHGIQRIKNIKNYTEWSQGFNQEKQKQ